jgi:hypothetical protein
MRTRGSGLKLDVPLVRGRASFMPRFVDNQGLAMEVYVDRATVTVPRGFETIELVSTSLGSQSWAFGACRAAGSRRAQTATWELILTSDDNEERITVMGPWLTLAWLAHLGGWAEPLTS